MDGHKDSPEAREYFRHVAALLLKAADHVEKEEQLLRKIVASPQGSAIDRNASANGPTHLQTIQTITPPHYHHDLGPGQDEFDGSAPLFPPAKQPGANLPPPPSPSLSVPEEQAQSRATSPHSLAGVQPAKPTKKAPTPRAKSNTPKQVGEGVKPAKPAKRATAPPPKSKKRKQDKEDEEDDVKPVTKKPRRQAYDETSKKSSRSEIFARHVKSTLNARSAEKTSHAAFADAIMPDNRSTLDLASPVLRHAVPLANQLPDLGDTSGLHDREITVCKELAITCDTYRCQKARFFLGLAIFTEFNYQALEHDKSDFKPWNVGKSQCQLFNNMDVNKSSDLFLAFETWGWVEPMCKKDAGKKLWTISANYLQRFPETYRRKLMEEVARWEAENIANPELCLAKVS